MDPHSWPADFDWNPELLFTHPRLMNEDAACDVAEAFGAAASPAPDEGAAAPRRAVLLCQAHGCAALLGSLRAYNQRVRLCQEHMRADEVLTADHTLQRFCQKCNRLQPLVDFEGAKHTCASALATHNARRRRRKPDAKPETPPSDADASRNAAPGLDAVSAWLSEFAEHSSAPGANKRALMMLCVDSPGAASANAADAAMAAAAAAAVHAAALHGCTLHIKLPSARDPTEVPTGALRDVAADLFGAAPAPPTVAVRPGCVLLTLDALLPSRRLGAADAAASVAQRFGADASVLWNGAAPAGGGMRGAAPPPALWPAAMAPGGAEEWASLRCGALPAGAAWHARLAGRALDTAAGAGLLRLRLPRGQEGAALLEVQAADGGVSASRAVLLCRDADVAAQVAACAERAAAASPDADDAMQAVTRLLGDALRPAAPRRVRAAAAAAAAALGWDAALKRLLRDAAAAGDVAALLLAAAPHAAPGACTAELRSRAAAAWPAGACERAAAALRAASRDDAHLRPACAAAAALRREADPHAAAVLAAVAQALDDLDDYEEDDDEDEALHHGRVMEEVSGGADDDEYVSFLERRNGTHMRVVALLALLGNVMQLMNTARYVLLAPGPPGDVAALGAFNAAAVASTRLHPLRGGPPFSPLDVPWAVLVAHARLYFAAGLLLRLPLHIAWVAAAARSGRAAAPARARPAPASAYEVTFLAYLLADTAFYAFIELLAMHATGAAVEWAAMPSMVHAVGLAIGLRICPFRSRATRAFAAAKLLVTVAPLACAQAWRAIALNAGCASQAAVLLAGIACADARERALRKVAAAEREERAAAAKLPKC